MAYSRDTQTFIYWIIGCIANHSLDRYPESRVSVYDMEEAKKRVKKQYLNAIGYKGKKEPLESFKEDVGKIYDEAIESAESQEELREMICEEVIELTAKELQKFFMKYGDFSLALKLISQEGANKFTQYLLDYCYNNEIPLRWEIVNKLTDDELKRHVWICIMNRQCAISGAKDNVDLHHWVSPGEKSNDTGLKTPFISLSRKYHNEIHAIGKDSFKSKYKVDGVMLREEDIVELKNKGFYQSQFRAFKKGE